MTPQEAATEVKRKLAALEKFRREDVPDIIGTEAVKHYNQSFVNEGATDKELKKWDNVERRKPESEWYGFSLGANSQNPNKKPVETHGGASKKGKGDKIKKIGNTNFSPTRTKDKVLTGETSELKNATHYVKKPDRVTVRNDKPYAAVQNNGGQAKIFGKTTFTMKARPFIYRSQVLEAKIQSKIVKELKNITEQ
jgi:phage gpG-like protein